MSDATTEHRLVGLEPDNLLAFLALLGVLRALEEARPAWRPKVRWSFDTGPLRPIIRVTAQVSASQLIDATAEGIKSWGSAIREAGKAALDPEIRRIKAELSTYGLPNQLSDKDKEELKKLHNRLKKFERAAAEYKITDLAKDMAALRAIGKSLCLHNDRNALLVFAATAAQAVSKDRELIAVSTPLKFSSGQQAFVGTMIKLTDAADSRALYQSLFSPWTYRHRGDSLRMSPQEARWYSLCASDPTERIDADDDDLSGDGIAPSELGANILASLGLMSFPVPAMQTPMVPSGRDRAGEFTLSWPLYHGQSPLSLSALEHVLASETADKDITWFDARVFLLRPGSQTSRYRNVSYGAARAPARLPDIAGVR